VRRHGGLQSIPAENDLVVLAAQALQQVSGHKFGVDIHLHKRLPAGGGLGGGSSDAATVLLALNCLFDLGLSNTQLQEIGLQLGADVPVFVAGHTAWAEGVGEKLLPIELANRWYLVATPDCHVNTGELFSHPELTRDCPISTMAAFAREPERFGNVFETLVRRLYPQIDQCFTRLSDLGGSHLTGTGASVFVAFESQSAAQTAAETLDGIAAFVARGLTVSPAYKGG